MDEFIATITGLVTTYGLKLIVGTILLIVGMKLSKWFVRTVLSGKAADKLDPGLRTFLKSFLSIALNVLIIISVATYIGIPMTSFITMLASAGVAIGLALQGALSNLAGGVMILLFKPFKVGDYIEAGGNAGTVKAVTVFYTVLTTLDNKRVTVPNGSLTNAPIVNYSTESKRRVDLVFGVSYSSDIEAVKRVIRETALENGLIIKEPEPFIGLSSYNDSAVEFTLRVWCKTEDYWTVYFDINERMKGAFDKNGIEIPFPQLDVHSC